MQCDMRFFYRALLQKRPPILKSLLIVRFVLFVCLSVCVCVLFSAVATTHDTHRHTQTHTDTHRHTARRMSGCVVGSLQLWVSFAEYRLFYRAFLQKRATILKSLLIVATPYWHRMLLRHPLCSKLTFENVYVQQLTFENV